MSGVIGVDKSLTDQSERTPWDANAWHMYTDACARHTHVERQSLSVSQLAELLGFEPERFIGLQVNRRSQTIWLILEPEA